MDIQCYIESGRNSNPKKKLSTVSTIGHLRSIYTYQQFILFRSEDQENEELNQPTMAVS